VLRRRQGDIETVQLDLLPPITLFGARNAGTSNEPTITDRRHDDRIEALREATERREIAMVVMIVAEQHDGYGRKIVEPHAGVTNAAWAEKIERTRAAGVHRIAQHIPGGRLYQPR
jgi:hypothetical protein